MNRRLKAIQRLLICLSFLNFSSPVWASVSAPVLKWQHGGCYASWCETGWYASAAVVDLNGDGTMEVVAGAYSIFILDGTTGSLIKQIDPEGGRIWPGIVIADLDGDNDPEIVTAHGDGYVHVFDHLGVPLWSRRPAGNELRGLSVSDLDHDGVMEVIVNAASYDSINTWVFAYDGTLRSGWPQLSSDNGYAYGVFNDNAAIADLDGDGHAEIIVPSDVHYICAYRPNGEPLPTNAIYGDKAWGKVGVWENLAIELRGWGTCSVADSRDERYRANFAHGAAAVGDLDGDGTQEIVATGNVYDCAMNPYLSRYTGVYIFNADRSRFHSSGFDWQVVPVDTGAPLNEDYNIIENCQPNPVIADLDGDGRKEILFSSYDGRVHAFWLDRTEHGNWPYTVYDSSEGVFRFASEPVVADLDGDSLAEVIFCSWVQKGTGLTGKLHILNYRGNVIHEVQLPPPYGGADWNGGLAAPTLADIDGDADLEVVVNTANSGIVAYDLPGTSRAKVQWPTGRGGFYRSGVASSGTKACTADFDGDGDVDGYDLFRYLENSAGVPLADIAGSLGNIGCP
jgi:hypothetical protein